MILLKWKHCETIYFKRYSPTITQINDNINMESKIAENMNELTDY
jgi:hypothetical protein